MDCDHAHLTEDDPVLALSLWLASDGEGLSLSVQRCGGLDGPFLVSALRVVIGALQRLEDAARREGAQLN
jgi:hypothetical protein